MQLTSKKMPNNRCSKKILILFNLSTDDSNPILAFTTDWISTFASMYSEVYVFSTHVGTHDLPTNVHVMEIGGGNFRKKIHAILRLIRVSINLLSDRRNLTVFHHMSPRTVVITGLMWRFARVPQGLWYSHSHASHSFKFASLVVDKLFTSRIDSIPSNTSKVCAVGHGISTERFILPLSLNPHIRAGISAVGRISRVKNLQDAVIALHNISTVSSIPRTEFALIGDITNAEDFRYREEILNLGEHYQLDIVLRGMIPRGALPDILAEYSIQFSGTQGSIDKAALEGAATGCFIVSNNRATLIESGMTHVFGMDFADHSVEDQIIWLMQLDTNVANDFRMMVSTFILQRHNISNTLARISDVLEDLRAPREFIPIGDSS